MGPSPSPAVCGLIRRTLRRHLIAIADLLRDRYGDHQSVAPLACVAELRSGWEVFAPFLGDNNFGTFARGVQSKVVFGPGNVNADLSIFKEFQIHEQTRFQFRAESFNVFGNVNLNNPRTALTNLTNPGLTQITGAGPARRLQFAAKILF